MGENESSQRNLITCHQNISIEKNISYQPFHGIRIFHPFLKEGLTAFHLEITFHFSVLPFVMESRPSDRS